jgi:hypothetical protein
LLMAQNGVLGGVPSIPASSLRAPRAPGSIDGTVAHSNLSRYPGLHGVHVGVRRVGMTSAAGSCGQNGLISCTRAAT